MSLKNEINQDIVSIIIALLNQQKIKIGGGGGGGDGDDGVNWPTPGNAGPGNLNFSPETLAQLTKFLPKDFKLPTHL